MKVSRRIEIILAGAAAEFHMPVERMVGRRRSSREFTARTLAMTALCDFTNLTWRDIARTVNREQAKGIKPGVRQYLWMSGALERIAARLREAGLEPKPATPTPRPVPHTKPQAGPQIDAILAAVCARFGVSHEVLSSSRRLQNLTPVRVAAIHALRKFTALSTTAIGDILDRDHSTVVHHLQQGPKYPWLPATLRDIETQLSAGAAQAAA